MKRKEIQYQAASELVSRMTREETDAYAQEAARLLKFSPGGDIRQLVTRLGGRLHVVDVFEQIDEDSIYVHGENDFDIIVSAISSPRRDRFTIAHELGHYYLHSRQGEFPLVATRNGSNRAEWEANWFAAGFLMPAKQFRQAFSSYRNSKLLAEMFGVSERAAEIRLSALHLKV